MYSQPKNKAKAGVVIIGNTNSGKSTTAGHLLHKHGLVSHRMIEKYERDSAEMGKQSFKFAWVVDQHRVEREQGSSIDITLHHLRTSRHTISLLDTPGNRDFIKNTITAISQADCALFVVGSLSDESEESTYQRNRTREFFTLLLAFNIRQWIVAVNKMDLVQWSEACFNKTVHQVSSLMIELGCSPEETPFIPISGWYGDNLMEDSQKMHWYKGWSKETVMGAMTGKTLSEALESIKLPKLPLDKPLRIPIQDVCKVPGVGIVSMGRVQTGVIKPGMELTFAPAAINTTVSSIQSYHMDLTKGLPGDYIGFNSKNLTLQDIRRGSVCSDTNNDPAHAVCSFIARIVILDYPNPIRVGYSPIFDCHTAHVACTFAELIQTIDTYTGHPIEIGPSFLKSGDSALVKLVPCKPLCVEPYTDYPSLSRFTVRDMYRTVACGVVLSVVKDFSKETVIRALRPSSILQ